MSDDTYRILVTGSRHWTDAGMIAEALLDARERTPTTSGPRRIIVVEGACPIGADDIAHKWAAKWGWLTERHPADWSMSRTMAGKWRNSHMVNLGADVCLAFILPCIKNGCPMSKIPHGSHGTSDCAAKAEAAGIEVRSYP